MSARRDEAVGAAGELGRRVAVAGALGVALLSLLVHAPVWLACARGAGTLFVLGVATRVGAAALARALDSDRMAIQPKKEPHRP